VLLGIFQSTSGATASGSHIFSPHASDSIRNIYDSVGIIGILLIFTFGGRIIWPL